MALVAICDGQRQSNGRMRDGTGSHAVLAVAIVRAPSMMDGSTGKTDVQRVERAFLGERCRGPQSITGDVP
jgi:hypothetical protein